MKNHLVLTFLLGASISTFATPTQLEILGLIPGISDADQVQQASVDPTRRSESSARLEIGGYKIPCALTMQNGKFSALTCFTGKGTKRSELYTEASNFEVQTILVAGFTKKFGKPDSTKAKTVRTGMGVEYEQTVVVWTDTQGNRLELMSIFDTVNAGVIILESAEHIKRSAQERMEEEKKKKF